MFAIAGLVAAPVFIDLGKYKSDFSAVIKNFTGATPIIEGNVSVSFFPSPSLTIGNIRVPNVENAASASIFVADGVEAKFTFQSLIHGKFDPSSITLIRPRIELEKYDNGDRNWIKVFENNDKSAINETLNIPLKLVIKNGTLVYRSGLTKSTIDYINSNIRVDSAHGPFDFKGSFLVGATTVNFAGDIGTLTADSTAEFNVNSDTFDFKMKGNYKPGKDFDIHGEAALNINNMGKFVNSFLSEEPLLSQIESSENLVMKGGFVISSAITSFNKLSIESKSIKGKGNIDVLYGAGKNGGVQWDVGLNIDKINIDSLQAKEEKAKKGNKDIIDYYTAGATNINLAAYHFDLPSDFSALFYLSIGEVVYNNDKLSNISIDTDIFNGKAIIHSFSSELPGNSKIELIGNIDNNGERPLLIGKVKASGDNLRKAVTWLYPAYSFIPESELKEFLFSCDLNVTPRKMTISNIYGSVDKSLLNGSLFVRPSDTVPSIKTDIKLDRIDFDKYNATKQIDGFVREFLANAKDSNIDGSWLKLFNYKLSLLVSGDEITYNGNNIKNFSTTIGVVKGLMSVQNVSIDSDALKMQGKFNIDFNKEVPLINVDLVSKYFDTSAFIVNKDDKKEANIVADANASIWSKQEFNLMGIERFGGNFNLGFDVLKHKNVILKSVVLKGELKKDIFAINECKADFGDKGKIDIKGNIGVSKEAPSVGISVTAAAINIQDLLKTFGSENKMRGYIYTGGVFKTFGISPYDWIKEAKTTAKFAMRDVEIEGIDLPMIIEQSRRLYSVIDMDSVIQNASKSGKTRFNAIDGNITTENSILKAKDFMIATERSRGIFVGNVSLHNLKMKGAAKVSYIPEVNKKVTLGFDMEGTIPDAITYKIDRSNLEQYITGKANK